MVVKGWGLHFFSAYTAAVGNAGGENAGAPKRGYWYTTTSTNGQSGGRSGGFLGRVGVGISRKRRIPNHRVISPIALGIARWVVCGSGQESSKFHGTGGSRP